MTKLWKWKNQTSLSTNTRALFHVKVSEELQRLGDMASRFTNRGTASLKWEEVHYKKASRKQWSGSKILLAIQSPLSAPIFPRDSYTIPASRRHLQKFHWLCAPPSNGAEISCFTRRAIPRAHPYRLRRVMKVVGIAPYR